MDQPSNQVCPTCGLPPLHVATITSGRIVSASLVCALEHLWIVKWAEQRPAQDSLRARIEHAATVIAR